MGSLFLFLYSCYALCSVVVVLEGYAIATTTLFFVEKALGTIALDVDIFLVPIGVNVWGVLKHISTNILLLFIGQPFVFLKRVASTVTRYANSLASATITVVVFAVELATF